MSTPKTPPAAFEPEFVQLLTHLFVQLIVFETVRGL